MSNSNKSVSTFTIKKGTFNLNEYNSSYSNTPIYQLVADRIEQGVKQSGMAGVAPQVFDYFYDRGDFRAAGEVETYYIVGYKDVYNLAEHKKPFLARFLYNRLISYFNHYLSSTLYDTQNEDVQKLVDALNIVYKDNNNDINKTIKLVDTLWDVYLSDDTLETNFDVRDKITEGFQQSKYYKEFVDGMHDLIQRKFDVKKADATYNLIENMVTDKQNQIDEHYGAEFQSQLKHYNQLQNEIEELNNTLNNL